MVDQETARADRALVADVTDWVAVPEKDDEDELTGLWQVVGRVTMAIGQVDEPRPVAVIVGRNMPENVAKVVARLPDYLDAWAQDR